MSLRRKSLIIIMLIIITIIQIMVKKVTQIIKVVGGRKIFLGRRGRELG